MSVILLKLTVAFVAALFFKDIESFVQKVKIYDFNFAENGFYVPETIGRS